MSPYFGNAEPFTPPCARCALIISRVLTRMILAVTSGSLAVLVAAAGAGGTASPGNSQVRAIADVSGAVSSNAAVSPWQYAVISRARYDIDYDVIPYGAYRSVVVAEGTLGQQTDAFDGVMGIAIGRHGLTDAWDGTDEKLRRSPGQLDFGPYAVGERLRVRTSYRAIGRTNTLRVLVRMRNTSNSALSARFQFSGTLGSVNRTEIEETSSRDRTFEEGDRWAITSENVTDNDIRSPAVIQVFAGRGGRTGVTEGHIQEGYAGQEVARMPVRIPAGSARYILAFLSLEEYTAKAGRAVTVFDRRRPPPALLRGMDRRVQGNVLNWDLS